MDLPTYVCHKTVQAAKVVGVRAVDGKHYLDLDGYPTLEVSSAYMIKHEPHSGGYYVRYQDGYESFSPASAFELGYTLEPQEAPPEMGE